MSNDLYQPDGGQVAPFQPGGDLQPYSPQDDWGRTDVDYLDNRAEHAFAPDAAPEMQQVYREIGITIAADLQRLNHPMAWINAAQNWYAKNIGTEPRVERKQHRFDLHSHAGDPLAESFGNMAHRCGASQEFVSNALWLLEEMVRRLTAGNSVPAHAGAPTSGSATAILDSLDDATYDYVVRHNANVAAQTESYLRAKWRDSYSQNLATANQYLANLPESHRDHFDQFEPGTWTLALNSATTIEGLFKNAIGGHNLPTGAGLQAEIAQIERLMRENRKAYNSDLQIQSRYRTLLELRGH